MNRMLLSSLIISSLYISSCAQIHTDTPTLSAQEKKTVVQTVSNDGIKPQDTPGIPEEKMGEEESTKHTMENGIKEYWVQKPGTLVYNSGHEITRSLRFQPTVSVHEVVEGRGLINPAKGEWVNMSDLLESKPENMLVTPQDSSGMPRITAEEMMNISPK